ncbi:unnamed protein product [Clonostachys byssicola]|uniref:Uncharacterized protein n=1 Tax=Clonostachys byssicola TaxID=160290 RepID=A0A9N9UD41_9HYPO|nr:unnamed protein product [Clonostachys byssicola]
MSAAIPSGAFGGLLAGAITSDLPELPGDVGWGACDRYCEIQEDNVTVRTKEEKVGVLRSFVLAVKDRRTIDFIRGHMYMTVLIYAVAFVCTAISDYFADKVP